MNLPFVWLCPEITRAHALTLMHWLEDERVTRYLSDSREVSRFVERVVQQVPLPVLTHVFNRGGRFFMVCDQHDVPVGFVRLVMTGRACEVVLVIGNPADWGRQLGASAIREAMKLAFFEMRAEKLVAKVHADNARSLKVFERCGFLLEGRVSALKSLSMSSDRYLRLLREGFPSPAGNIHITETDLDRLRDLVAFEHASASFELEHELQRAIVVDPRRLEQDVVTMNSRCRLQLDDDEEVEVTLVYPDDADDGAGRLSVGARMGTAILGYREGDAFAWRLQDRTCRIRIVRTLYQPEAAGDLHL